MKFKKLNDQVVVLMGASSGIGRVAAKQFAAAGSLVVVAARSAEGLEDVVAEITNAGGKAVSYVADTTDAAQVNALAAFAVQAYGRIDTWVHLAGVGLAAEWEQITSEEFRQVLELNLIGMFHGLKAAVPELRKQGGAFIGLGSVESTVTFPFHTAYGTSKHAVAGMLDGVRHELIHYNTPVSITNIRPAAIDTPFFERQKEKLGLQPKAPPPTYTPEDVSRAILYAATTPARDVFVGGGGRLISAFQSIAPTIADKLIAVTQWKSSQFTDKPKPIDAPNGLEGPIEALNRDYGHFHGRPSVYTWIRTNPKTTLALAAAAIGATVAVAHEVSEKHRDARTLVGRLRRHAPDLKPFAEQAGYAWERVAKTAGKAANRWF